MNKYNSVIHYVTKEEAYFEDFMAEAVAAARKAGLSVPVVYNTGGFERPEIIKMLQGTVDIFLTDSMYRGIQRKFHFTKYRFYSRHFWTPYQFWKNTTLLKKNYMCSFWKC